MENGSMTTGTYRWTASDGNKKSIFYTVTWSLESQDVVTNTSRLRITVKSGGGSTYSVHEKKAEILIDGDSVWYRGTTADRKSGATIYNDVVTIQHQNDGYKTINIMFRVAMGANSTPNLSASATVTLDWIPRASRVSVAPESMIPNGSNRSTVTINPYVSTYSHEVRWSIGSYGHTETLAAGVNSVSYAIPTEWRRGFVNATTGACTITVKTFLGSDLIGTATATQTLSVDTAADVPAFTIGITDASGIFGKISAYVKNRSKITASANGINLKYGATVKEIEITIGGYTSKGTATSATAQSVISADNTAVTIKVTDSRGLSKTLTTSVQAFAYSQPSLALSINRYASQGVKDDEGGLGRVEYHASISAIGNNAVQSVKIEWAALDGTGSGNVTKTTADGEHYMTANTELVYSFVVAVTDRLETVVYKKMLSSAVTIMDILAGGNGVCIGGVATRQNTLDVRWSILPMAGISYAFADSAGADEKALMKAKIDLMPNVSGMYPIPGGWQGKQYGASIGMVAATDSYVRKFALMMVANGTILMGYSVGSGDNDYYVYKFTGTKL